MLAQLKPEREQRLIEQSLADDEAAFRELFQHYFPAIYAYAARKLRHTQDAEDVVQNVFIKVIDKLNTFEYRGPGSFRAWLFTIASREVIQFSRNSRHMQAQVSLETHAELASRGMSLEDRADLNILIADLPPQQQVLVDSMRDNLTNREMSSLLGIPESTVSDRLKRARQVLRRWLDIEQ